MSPTIWVLETESRFSVRADALLMAEPPLQPYLRFSFINKTKATHPLNVLGVYYLNLLPKAQPELPDALLFPCACSKS